MEKGKVKAHILRLYLALAFALLAASILNPDIFTYFASSSGHIFGINFDSASTNAAGKSIKEFTGPPEHGKAFAAISFQLNVSTITGYNDPFQTADFNSGIRMELSPPSNLGLVVGNSVTGLEGFILSHGLKPHKWYKIKIALSRHGHLQAFIDGRPVLDHTNKDIDVSFSHIKIGAGFNEERVLNGRIADFSIKHAIYRPTPHPGRILFGVRMLSLIALIFGLYILKQSTPGQFRTQITWTDIGIPLLAGAYPVLFLYLNNIREVSVYAIILPLALALAASIALFFFTYFVTSTSEKAAVYSATILIAIFSIGRLHAAISTVYHGIPTSTYLNYVIICTTAIVWAISYLEGRILTKIKRIFDISLITLVIYTTVLIFIQGALHSRIKPKAILPPNIKSSSQKFPDIYYIILDAHASEEVLHARFNYKESPLFSFLRKSGFILPAKPFSNYRSTMLSLPSSLNMEYINNSSREELPEIYERNKVTQYLKKRGYKFIFINPNEVIRGWNNYADLNIRFEGVNNFTSLLLKTTVFLIIRKGSIQENERKF